MITLRYQVTLLEPVLATALEGDPNSSVSYKYLPGSVIRGALIGRALRSESLKLDQIATDGSDARKLFFSGETRFLNAYVVMHGKRALPTPQTWRQTRDDADRHIYDVFENSPNGAKGVKRPFFVKAPEQGLKSKQDKQEFIHLIDPSQQISVHTFRQNRALGRPRRGSGAVFQYEALSAGQTFEGLILCDSEVHVSKISNLLTGEGFIGGARSAGYGKVRFTLLTDDTAEYKHSTGATNAVTITLLSDLIIRDTYGHYTTDAEALVQPVSALFPNITGWALKDCALKLGMVGGFNQKWGLPLPQAPVIQAGSVFQFVFSGSLTPFDLDNAALRGIGERRLDGFGRVAFAQFGGELPPVPPTEGEKEKAPVPPLEFNLDAPSQKIAQRMVARISNQHMQNRLIAITQSPAASVNNLKKAQIGRLRSAIRDALSDHDATTARQKIRDYMESVDKRQKARRQFESARFSARSKDQRLLYWINQTLAIKTDDEWEEAVGIKPKAPPDGQQKTVVINPESIKSLLGVPVSYTQLERDEYLLRLIDLVLARFAKLSQTEGAS